MFGIDDILDIIKGPIGTVVDRLVPDNNAAQKVKNEIQEKLVEADIGSQLAQLEINKADASNPSIFVAGARPGFMWLCVITLGWSWLVAPMLTWTLQTLHVMAPALPTLAADQAQTALYGLLGLGAYRTVDKIWAQPDQVTKAIGKR